jgi:hypothetical protein
MYQQHVRMPFNGRQVMGFLPKRRYGKTVATVQTM